VTNYKQVGNLKVAPVLYQFINEEALPGSGLSTENFWSDFEALVTELTPVNKRLLEKRDQLQAQINAWHQENPDGDFSEYKSFLTRIGYLEDKTEDFLISTEGVDSEIAYQAGPQLVVPVNNARYAINAANARWGSLYDALYGTDAISEENGASRTNSYNPIRGEKVIAFAKNFLDAVVPLVQSSHAEVVQYSLENGKLVAQLNDGSLTELQEEEKFVGYQGEEESPDALAEASARCQHGRPSS